MEVRIVPGETPDERRQRIERHLEAKRLQAIELFAQIGDESLSDEIQSAFDSCINTGFLLGQATPQQTAGNQESAT